MRKNLSPTVWTGIQSKIADRWPLITGNDCLFMMMRIVKFTTKRGWWWSIPVYLQPIEWEAFLQRTKCSANNDLIEKCELRKVIGVWMSIRFIVSIQRAQITCVIANQQQLEIWTSSCKFGSQIRWQFVFNSVRWISEKTTNPLICTADKEMTTHPSPSYFLLQENCPLSAQSKIPPNEPRHESNYVAFSYILGVIAVLLIQVPISDPDPQFSNVCSTPG